MMGPDEEDGGTAGAEESLKRAEELLARLEATRAELERVAERDDAESAIDILGELSDLARQVEAELVRARREAGA